MAHECRSYAYVSLQHSDSIRLIELLPGVQGSPLSCNITEVQKANSPKYEALSYAWGELIFSHEIVEVTKSMPLSITVNLHDALQAIRLEHESRILWIDAICINQSDLKEKGHQVASMGRIYGDAWRVIVFLGSPKFTISRMIDLLTEIIDSSRHCSARGQNADVRAERALTRLTASKFLQQSWYTRVWAVQEFILARDPQFQLADGLLPPALLENAFEALQYIITRIPMEGAYNFHHRDLSYEFKRNFQLFSYRRRRISVGSQHTNLSLISCVIDLAHARECKDPRDRLYAMLAVAEDNLRIEPDYEIPLSAALNKLATRSLLSGDLFVLHTSGIRPNHDPNLLSFTPSVEDWVGMTMRLNTDGHKFCAANTSLVSVSPGPANSLSLRGVRIDTVKSFNETLPYHMFHDSYEIKSRDARLVSWINGMRVFLAKSVSVMEVCQLNQPYKSTPPLKILYRTMTLDDLGPISHNSETPPLDWHDWSDIYRKLYGFSHLNVGLYENRYFFDTQQGYFGLGPCWMKPDDQIVILDGGKTPFILRKVRSEDEEPGDTWQLVGDCFLLGWMYGDYFGHTVVDEMPIETEKQRRARMKRKKWRRKKYLVKENFTLV